MNKMIVKSLGLMVIGALALIALACNPEAHWETKKVTVNMWVQNVSAGFADCIFFTDKEAYYLVAIEPVRKGFDPMSQQKQFMQLALDSAYASYLSWRKKLLDAGEFNVAPFASHALQYGEVDYFFTGLKPDTKYWIYAFVVNPDKMTPAGKLYLETIQTAVESDLSVTFEYRVKGYWDYVYPLDDHGFIDNYFPYVGTTRDSLDIAAANQTPKEYFQAWLENLLDHPENANVLYGVKAVENDGWDGHIMFEQGHTYYTAISAFDGPVSQSNVIYKFTWNGEDTEYYFKEEDSL